jgi:hypothetical protein
LIGLLRPRATLWGRIQGTGKWGVSFRRRGDLLFCWVEAGECQLMRPRAVPVFLQRGDFVPIRTSPPFSLTSAPELEPEDSEAIVAATGSTELAKDELSYGTKAIGEIAIALGFHASSAFSTAFTRLVGRSPKRFAIERTGSKQAARLPS